MILLTMPQSPLWSLSLRFLRQNPVHVSSLPNTHYMPSPSYWCIAVTNTKWNWVAATDIQSYNGSYQVDISCRPTRVSLGKRGDTHEGTRFASPSCGVQ